MALCAIPALTKGEGRNPSAGLLGDMRPNIEALARLQGGPEAAVDELRASNPSHRRTKRQRNARPEFPHGRLTKKIRDYVLTNNGCTWCRELNVDAEHLEGVCPKKVASEQERLSGK